MIYKIKRTRTITELLRVRSDSEEEAIAMLQDCDCLLCPERVEQLDFSTAVSSIEVLEADSGFQFLHVSVIPRRDSRKVIPLSEDIDDAHDLYMNSETENGF